MFVEEDRKAYKQAYESGFKDGRADPPAFNEDKLVGIVKKAILDNLGA